MVDEVIIRGQQKVSSALLQSFFKSVKHCKTMDQLNQQLNLAVTQCDYLDSFSTMDIALDVASQQENIKHVVVHIDVQELVRNKLTAGTTVNTMKQVEVNAQAGLRNLLGVGDYWSMDLKTNDPKTNLSFNINTTFPQVIRSTEHSGEVNVGAEIFGNHPVLLFQGNGLSQRVHGAHLGLQVAKNHHATAGLQFRSLFSHAKTIAEDELSNLKGQAKATSSLTYLKHIYNRDGRRWSQQSGSPYMVLKGGLLRCTNQLAVPYFGGDTHFLKSEIEAQYNIPLYKKIGLIGTVQANLGTIFPLLNEQKIYLNDRFLYDKVRGYTDYLGSEVDSKTKQTMGGNVKALLLSRLQLPIPNLYDYVRAQLQFFVHSGNVEQLDQIRSTFAHRQRSVEFVQQFWNQMKTSAGVGLVFVIGNNARIEVNYSVPISLSGNPNAIPSDKFQKFGAYIDLSCL